MMERVAPLLLETSKSGPYFYVCELPHHTHTHCIFHFPAPRGSLPLSNSPALTASTLFFLGVFFPPFELLDVIFISESYEVKLYLRESIWGFHSDKQQCRET